MYDEINEREHLEDLEHDCLEQDYEAMQRDALDEELNGDYPSEVLEASIQELESRAQGLLLAINKL